MEMNDQWKESWPKCGCGRAARYMVHGGEFACNKYLRCPDALVTTELNGQEGKAENEEIHEGQFD